MKKDVSTKEIHTSKPLPEKAGVGKHLAGTSRAGYLLVLLTAFFGAWQSSCMRLLQNRGLPALDTVTLLFVFAAILTWGWLLAGGRGKTVVREAREHWKILVPLGFANFGISLGLFMAVKTLSPGVAAVLLATAPAQVCLFFLISRLKPISLLNKLAVVLSVFGCMCALNVFHTALSELSFSGIAWGLLSGACTGAYTVGCDMFVSEKVPRTTIMAVGVTVGCLLSILVNPTMFLRFPALGLFGVGVFLYVALTTKLVNMSLLAKASPLIGSENVSIVQTMEVPFTLLVAYITLGETMVPIQLLGVGMVIVSVILLQRKAG